MQKGKKVNGISDVDTPQMAQMRTTVIEQELSARSWKAYYDKMYYALEAEKLEPLYKEYQERTKEKLQKEAEAFEKFKAALQEELEKRNEADPEGEIKIEEAN